MQGCVSGCACIEVGVRVGHKLLGMQAVHDQNALAADVLGSILICMAMDVASPGASEASQSF